MAGVTVAFDTLKAATRLQEEAGFDQTKARVLVSTFAEGMVENLATKDDIVGLRRDFKPLATKEELADFRRDFKPLATKEELADFRREFETLATKEELASLRRELETLATKESSPASVVNSRPRKSLPPRKKNSRPCAARCIRSMPTCEAR